MILTDLLKKIDYVSFIKANDRNLENITSDSRKVQKDWVFLAIKGKEFDGHKFIDKAVELGANTIVFSEDIDYRENINYIRVSDSRLALADISNVLTDFPSKKLRVFGVTGTNGKTTTSTLISFLLEEMGEKSANIGTNGAFFDEKKIEVSNTTPEITEINTILKECVNSKVKNAVIEASSHGLFLDRLRGVDFDFGVFTNLSIEHMDFHKTMENYFKAKMILLESSMVQIVNIDDSYGQKAKDKLFKNAVTFSIEKHSDYRAENIKSFGDHFEFYVNDEKFILNRISKYDIYNSLAAIAALNKSSFSLTEISKALEKFRGIEARFEFVKNDLGINIVIDFAHTPEAFDNVYKSIKKGANIIAVYGMTGDRVYEIRKEVGQISAKNGAFSVITTDDPKFDTYENIANDIEEGVKLENGKCAKIKDRKEAIAFAIKKAKKGDFVLLLGKGQEHFLKLKGNTKTYYNEKETVEEILKEIWKFL